MQKEIYELGNETRKIIQKVEEDIKKHKRVPALKFVLAGFLGLVSAILFAYNIYTLFILF